jgi:hypothetical protein
LSSLAVVAVAGELVAVVVLVDSEQPLATLFQQAFLSRCLLALLALLAQLQSPVVMAAHPPSSASPLLGAVVAVRLVEPQAVDLAALVAVVRSVLVLLAWQHQSAKATMAAQAVQMEYFGPVLAAAVHLLLVAPPVLARLLVMAAMAQPPAFQVRL